MDFSITENQKGLIRDWRDFTRKQCPREYVQELDETGGFPHAFLRKAGEGGRLGLPFPVEYGGRDLSIFDQVLIFEEVARWAFSVSQSLGMVWLFGGTAILRFGTREQKDYYVPMMMAGDMKIAFGMTEPDAGSDATSLSTFAELDGDSYVVNGSKIFITGAGHTERMLLITRTEKNAPASVAYTIFLVDPRSPGITLNKLRSHGRNSPGTYEVFVDNLRVKASDVVGEVNAGWAELQTALENERVCASAMYLGTSQTAIDDTVAFAREEVKSGKPLARDQVIRHYLADMQTRVDATRLLIYRAAWQVSNGIPCATEASMAKLFSGEAFVYVTDLGMKIMGDHGYTDEYDMQHYFRDAKASTIGGGTSEMQRNMIASAILR